MEFADPQEGEPLDDFKADDSYLSKTACRRFSTQNRQEFL